MMPNEERAESMGLRGCERDFDRSALDPLGFPFASEAQLRFC